MTPTTGASSNVVALVVVASQQPLITKGQHIPHVVHFEIYTRDPDAVRPFYQDVFGWQFEKFEVGPMEYWVVTTGDDKQPGINGGLTRPREGQTPGTLNTIGVSSLDQTIRQIPAGPSDSNRTVLGFPPTTMTMGFLLLQECASAPIALSPMR